MTCIIAVEYDGKVFMGGDSACLSGWDIEIGKKVFINGDFIFGHTGYLRFSQLIEFSLSLPERVEFEGDMRHIVSRVVPAIRDLLKQNGYTKIENNTEKTDDLLLIGYHGKIYKINSDFSVMRASRKYTAVGCGQDFALGVLAAYYGSSQFDPGNTEGMILAALKVSGGFSAGVIPPYYVLSR